MKFKIISFISFLIFSVSFVSSVIAYGKTGADYKRYNPNCKTCVEIEKLLSVFDSQQDDRAQIDTTLKIAQVIEKASIKDKSVENKRREIYFAIKATNTVLQVDFDSATVAGLMDLREQAPSDFDYVFWRFPFADQKEITHRMDGMKKSGIRPKATVPEAKAVSDD